MKNLFFILLLVIPVLTGCRKEENSDPYMQIREIAWNSLSTDEKSTVTIYWKVAKVNLSEYNSVPAYAVVFNTKSDALLGPIMVFIDPTSKSVLGKALRD
jgi:hypothetical protein